LPYSLLAIGASAGLFWWGSQWNGALPWAWLFAFIAIVTLPHMLLLDRVYGRLQAEWEG
jgi:Flp pilus assembly protein TadB